MGNSEEDDLEMLKTFLAQIAREAHSRDALGRNLIDELDMRYDQYLSINAETEKLRPQEPPMVRAFEKIRRGFGNTWYVIQHGYLPPAKSIPSSIAAHLEKEKKISRGERRLIEIYGMIKATGDGAWQIIGAPKAAHRTAKLYFLRAAILTIIFCYTALEIFSTSIINIPASITIGMINGWFWRDAYDYALGRNKLARKLKQTLPWMSLQIEH